MILFAHPRDNINVCANEVSDICRLKKDFDKLNAKALGLTIDSMKEHRRWTKDIEEKEKVKINFPILADQDRKVSEMYGMLQPAETIQMVLVRSVYIIDPNSKIRLIIHYPPSIGRNFDEFIRVIEECKRFDRDKPATPIISIWKK